MLELPQRLGLYLADALSCNAEVAADLLQRAAAAVFQAEPELERTAAGAVQQAPAPGLEDDLVLSLIVPIAMISFGVDFAFHGVGRYREERVGGREPRRRCQTDPVVLDKPLSVTLAQAGRVPGVSPTDLQNLVLEVEKLRRLAVS